MLLLVCVHTCVAVVGVRVCANIVGVDCGIGICVVVGVGVAVFVVVVVAAL